MFTGCAELQIYVKSSKNLFKEKPAVLIMVHQIPSVSDYTDNTSVKHGREIQPPAETPHRCSCMTDNQALGERASSLMALSISMQNYIASAAAAESGLLAPSIGPLHMKS